MRYEPYNLLSISDCFVVNLPAWFNLADLITMDNASKLICQQ